MRSDLKALLPDRFLPAPFPIERSDAGLVVPKPEAVTETTDFPPLLLRLSLAQKPVIPGYPLIVPYDLYCPSLGKCLKGKYDHSIHLLAR